MECIEEDHQNHIKNRELARNIENENAESGSFEIVCSLLLPS